MAESTTETPVLDLLARMTADSISVSNLDAETLVLVRIAALAAVDAPPVSYLLNLEAAGEVGIDPERSAECLPQSHRSSARRESRPRRATSSARSTSRSRSRSSTSKTRNNRAGQEPPLVGGAGSTGACCRFLYFVFGPIVRVEVDQRPPLRSGNCVGARIRHAPVGAVSGVQPPPEPSCLPPEPLRGHVGARRRASC